MASNVARLQPKMTNSVFLPPLAAFYVQYFVCQRREDTLKLSLAAYDTGAGASGMKTNKQTDFKLNLNKQTNRKEWAGGD